MDHPVVTTLILTRNLVSTGPMNKMSMKEDPCHPPPRAVTECDTPCELGLTKQGCYEMMYIYHPAVLNLGHLVSDIHAREEEEEVMVRIDGHRIYLVLYHTRGNI